MIALPDVQQIQKEAAESLQKLDKSKETLSGIYLDDFVIDERAHILKNLHLPKKCVQIQPIDLTRTLICLGKMGSGKTKFFENLLLQDWGYERAVIHDLKGEYVEKFYDEEKDYIFNPFDKRTAIWDLWSDIRRNSALMQKVAKGLVFATSGKEDFWTSAASKVLEDAFVKAAFGQGGGAPPP